MKNIKESEMNFGNFDEKNLFEIENSSLLKKLGAGIKTVEFILLKSGNSIIFLEAKKTCPNEKNMRETSKKEEKFEQYYNSIVEKSCRTKSNIRKSPFSLTKNMGYKDFSPKL